MSRETKPNFKEADTKTYAIDQLLGEPRVAEALAELVKGNPGDIGQILATLDGPSRAELVGYIKDYLPEAYPAESASDMSNDEYKEFVSGWEKLDPEEKKKFDPVPPATRKFWDSL